MQLPVSVSAETSATKSQVFFGMPAHVTVLDAAKHSARRLPHTCLLYTSPSPRDLSTSRMPSSA